MPLPVAEVVQALLEAREAEPTGRVSWLEHTDPWQLPPWLCHSDGRHDEEAQGAGDDEPHGAEPPGRVLPNTRALTVGEKKGSPPR